MFNLTKEVNLIGAAICGEEVNVYYILEDNIIFKKTNLDKIKIIEDSSKSRVILQEKVNEKRKTIFELEEVFVTRGDILLK